MSSLLRAIGLIKLLVIFRWFLLFLKDLDLVAFPVRTEALRTLPAQIYPVDLSAMSYIKNRRGEPEQTWKDYYITIVGFPQDVRKDEVDPLRVSIGRIKGERGNICVMRNLYNIMTLYLARGCDLPNIWFTPNHACAYVFVSCHDVCQWSVFATGRKAPLVYYFKRSRPPSVQAGEECSNKMQIQPLPQPKQIRASML